MKRLALVLVMLGASTAAAERGTVASATSRWAGGMIVTDLVVRDATGAQVAVTEQGGSVDGIGMWVSHRDAPLHVGDVVELAHDRTGLRARQISAAPRDPASLRRVTAHAAAESGPGVQRTFSSGVPLYHPTGCLSFAYDAKGSEKVTGEWTAFDAAFDAWESASSTATCGGVTFTTSLVQDAPEGRDGINTIHFRDTRWCQPAAGTEAEICHAPDAVAVTRVLYIDQPWSERNGEILEVDIDVNAVDFTLTTDGRANAIDLQAAATHEIGHALGLDHNCGVEDGAWPAYADGTQVVSCESASADLVNATMYVQVMPGSLTMRTPKASDTANVCEVVNGVCLQEITAGCSSGGSTAGGSAAILLALVSLRRRRR